jgi:hypothetical protein
MTGPSPLVSTEPPTGPTLPELFDTDGSEACQSGVLIAGNTLIGSCRQPAGLEAR